MKVGIIGAGFTGLSAAVTLLNSGHSVEIFEKGATPGGLAEGFKDKGWDWSLEKHYHHIFTSDTDIINLAKKVGHKINFHSPKTFTWIESGVFPIDSPLSLLKFPGLSFFSRLRTGVVIGILKVIPFWNFFENTTAEKFIVTFMGKESWDVLWAPLMFNKFGPHYSKISAVWFWARIFKRSQKLGYPDGGFQNLAQSIEKYIVSHGGVFHYSTGVTSISQNISLRDDSNKEYVFDKIICTLPSFQFLKISPPLDPKYVKKLQNLSGVGAVNLILSLKKSLLPQDIYWLNVNTKNTPFLAVVEHTNFIDSSHYANQHLVYIGNYLPESHTYFHLSASQLIEIFAPYLKKLNPDFSLSWVRDKWVWKTNFAQPIIPLHYSKQVPETLTSIKNLYLANMQQVYPWDRGTNYAVKLGSEVAKLCLIG